jgi:rhodanese-related sulfurtransferase
MNLKHALCGAVLCFLCLAPRAAAPESQTNAFANRNAFAVPFAEDISPSDAASLIEEQRGNPDIVILDVRTAEEFSTGFIEGAVNIDYSRDNFEEKLESLDKNRTYLVYCRSGGRSRRVLELMRERGFYRIYNLTGGISLWRDENLPVTE